MPMFEITPQDHLHIYTFQLKFNYVVFKNKIQNKTLTMMKGDCQKAKSRGRTHPARARPERSRGAGPTRGPPKGN